VLALLIAAATGCSKDDPAAPPILTTTVMGTVADSAGAAVSGATVSLTLQSPNGIGLTTMTSTSAAGFFVFNNVAAGNYTIWARSSNGTGVAGTTTAMPRPNTSIAMTLRAPCVARGMVQGPDPLDVVVSCETTFDLPDSTGAYQVTGIPTGTWTFTLSRPLARTAVDTVLTFANPRDTVDVPPIFVP